MGGKQLETVAPGYAEGGCWNKSLGNMREEPLRIFQYLMIPYLTLLYRLLSNKATSPGGTAPIEHV